MKKVYLYLAIAGVVLYIIVQNKKDEEQEENRLITINGRRYWVDEPKWQDTKPAQPKLPPSEFVDTTEKNRRVGDGLIV